MKRRPAAPAAEVAVHPASNLPVASGDRYTRRYYAKHDCHGFRDRTTGKQVMQIQATKLKPETVKSIADKVFDELNKGVSIVDAKELARSLKEAHLGPRVLCTRHALFPLLCTRHA